MKQMSSDSFRETHSSERRRSIAVVVSVVAVCLGASLAAAIAPESPRHSIGLSSLCRQIEENLSSLPKPVTASNEGIAVAFEKNFVQAMIRSTNKTIHHAGVDLKTVLGLPATGNSELNAVRSALEYAARACPSTQLSQEEIAAANAAAAAAAAANAAAANAAIAAIEHSNHVASSHDRTLVCRQAQIEVTSYAMYKAQKGERSFYLINIENSYFTQLDRAGLKRFVQPLKSAVIAGHTERGINIFKQIERSACR